MCGQELANIAWGFAKVGHADAGFFVALARAVERRLDSFNAQELANTAWGFATAGHADHQLFRVSWCGAFDCVRTIL